MQTQSLTSMGSGSCVARQDVLSGRRMDIYGVILESPGIAFGELERAIGWGSSFHGSMTHHLFVLERAGLVRSEKTFRTRRYYASATAPKALQADAWLRTEPYASMARFLAGHPGATQQAIAEACHVTRQAVANRMERLGKLGLVRVTPKSGRQPAQYHYAGPPFSKRAMRPPRPKQPDQCKALRSCTKKPKAQGLCVGHYEQQRKGVSFAPLRPSNRAVVGPPKPCVEPLCDELSSARGRCMRHYKRERYAIQVAETMPTRDWLTGSLDRKHWGQLVNVVPEEGDGVGPT